MVLWYNQGEFICSLELSLVQFKKDVNKMGMVLSALAILGVLASVYVIWNYNKIKGVLHLAAAILCPIFTGWYCSLKTERAYGGSDWEFLVHSLKVDGDILAYMAFACLVIEVILIVYGIIKIFSSAPKGKNKNEYRV